VSASGVAKSLSIALALAAFGGCGKKGPPLPPLRLVPAAPVEVVATRSGDDVQLSFSLPTTNANGPGPIDLSRVEIYAITVGPSVTPPNRDLLVSSRVVGTIDVKPPEVEGETPKPGAPPDKRPGPGDRVTFVDQLTEAKKTPVPVKPDPAAKPAEGQKPPDAPPVGDPTGAKPDAPEQKPGDPAAATAASGAVPSPTAAAPTDQTAPTQPAATAATPTAAATAATQPTGTATAQPAPPTAQPPALATPGVPPPTPYPTRVYSIRGLSRSGRPGQPSARIIVPILDPIGAPTAVAVQMPTEKGVVVDWTPPVAEPGTPALAFNVYRTEAPGPALNPSPVAEAKFEIGGVELGKEQCFVVRTVQTFGNVTVESVPSAPACITPVDKFPPAAPQGLRAVAEDGAVSLVWDRNSEADLAGYIVLRGEVPGDPATVLTPEPIADANYRDTTVKPGVRYVYVIVAVDTASPRNQSGPSPREEVTAR
jgi:hypothetical protein